MYCIVVGTCYYKENCMFVYLGNNLQAKYHDEVYVALQIISRQSEQLCM